MGEIWKLLEPNQREKAVCRECGRDVECPLFRPDVIDELKKAETQSFWQVAERLLNAEHLISGDKSPRNYSKYTGVPSALLLLLKNPVAAALSYANRKVSGGKLRKIADKTERLELLLQGLDEYSGLLKERGKWLATQVNAPMFVAVEELVACPKEDMERLGEAILGKPVEYCPGRVRGPDMHYIAGNHKLSSGKDNSYFDQAFKPDRRYLRELNRFEIRILVRTYTKQYDFRQFLDGWTELISCKWLDNPWSLTPSAVG